MSDAPHSDVPPTEPSRQLFEELLREFSARLVLVFETMVGEKPGLEVNTSSEAPLPGALLWKQPLAGLDGALWLASAETDWTAAGTHILRAAGLGPEDTDADSIRSSYLETLSQALGGLAQDLSARAGREVTPKDGKAVGNHDGKAVGNHDSAPEDAQWGSLTLLLGETPAIIFVAIENSLLESLSKLTAASHMPEPPSSRAAAGESGSRASGTGGSGTGGSGTNDAAVLAAGKSKTFDLLLDVELPVSVSFGSAEVSLKDVLKLTTGSIIELNRTIQEPVEVVVNNCVIARGEVVVVEGNFGVRIQSVASRHERLRTLR